MVVEDHRDWRTSDPPALSDPWPEWQILCEVADGLEAVHKAEELKPDLILLDIGLPQLNGIAAAQRIRQLSPNSKILFVSMDDSQDVIQASFGHDLGAGAQGYVYKADGGSELLPAVEAVLRGQRFVSGSIKGENSIDIPGANAPHHHEVLFYLTIDDAVFLRESLRSFCCCRWLRAGNVVAVVTNRITPGWSFSADLKAEGIYGS